MAPTPVHHPLRAAAARRRALAAHPAGRGPTRVLVRAGDVDTPDAPAVRDADTRDSEDGSMTTEYGLLVVVGATVCSLVIKWASGGAIFELLGGVLDAARGLVGF